MGFRMLVHILLDFFFTPQYSELEYISFFPISALYQGDFNLPMFLETESKVAPCF